MPKCFNKLFKLKKKMKFYVFDVETWGLNATPEAFALGVIYGENYIFKSSNYAEFKEKLQSKFFDNSIIFAHNAIYDLSTMFGNILTDLDPNTVFNNSTFILSKFNKTTFADSLNILPTKLATIGEMLGKPKGETPQKFIKGKRGKITQKDFEYCEQDCEIIYEALDKLFNEIGCVRITLASLSMAYFRRNFLKDPIYYDDLVYKFFDSYAGGRVECFRLGAVNAQMFDINSMYPHAMKFAKFPNPAKLAISPKTTEQALRFYLEYYEGMATITVNHKKHFYGFLPVKTKTKLLFPTGKFTGTWNFPEIRFALQHGIIEILDIKEIVYAPAMDSIFVGFVDTLFAKRINSKSDFEKYLYKIILNSLYGKFAQRKKFKTKYVPDITDICVPLGATIIPFNKERDDAYIIEEENYFSYNTIPVFSSYITSFSRVNLLGKMLEYIENEVVYVDTDCIAVNNYTKEITTGAELGAFKLEKKIITNIIGNKSYETKDGQKTLKGVRKGAIQIADNTFQFQRMIKPKTALRRNVQAGTFITETKKVSSKYDKRFVNKDGSTRPIHIE